MATQNVITRAYVRLVAKEHGLTFVPLQGGFDASAQRAPVKCRTADGVHPTALGHEFIKNEWLRAFYTL